MQRSLRSKQVLEAPGELDCGCVLRRLANRAYCQARAVSRMDSYIILITKLLKDIVAKETEDASTVKIFPEWVPVRIRDQWATYLVGN